MPPSASILGSVPLNAVDFVDDGSLVRNTALLASLVDAVVPSPLALDGAVMTLTLLARSAGDDAPASASSFGSFTSLLDVEDSTQQNDEFTQRMNIVNLTSHARIHWSGSLLI
jgi:hypothetical protein